MSFKLYQKKKFKVRGPYYKTQKKYIINLKVFKIFYFDSKVQLEKREKNLSKKKISGLMGYSSQQ